MATKLTCVQIRKYCQ